MSKVHTLKCAAYNLGLLLRKVWGYCKPRNAEAAAAALFWALLLLTSVTAVVVRQKTIPKIDGWLGGLGLLLAVAIAVTCVHKILSFRKNRHFLTGC